MRILLSGILWSPRCQHRCLHLREKWLRRKTRGRIHQPGFGDSHGNAKRGNLKLSRVQFTSHRKTSHGVAHFHFRRISLASLAGPLHYIKGQGFLWGCGMLIQLNSGRQQSFFSRFYELSVPNGWDVEVHSELKVLFRHTGMLLAGLKLICHTCHLLLAGSERPTQN